MSYEVIVSRRADKNLDKLPAQVQERIDAAIDLLAEDPRPHPQSIELQGREGRRLRVGDYRVIYEVEEPHPNYPNPDEGKPGKAPWVGLVTVVEAGHRQGIYG